MQPCIKLSQEMIPKSDEKKHEMNKITCSIVVGSSMYCMVCSKPDIVYVVCTIAQFMSSLGAHHWGIVKKNLQYLQGTKTFQIKFKGNMQKSESLQNLNLIG
jgi:hypothetical protein